MKSFKQYLSEAVIKLGSGKRPPEIDDFMDDYYDSTQDHPFNDRARVHTPLATTEIHPFGNEIHISDVVAHEPGAGSAAIEHLKALADKHKVTLSGTAVAYAQSKKHPMTNKQLAGWYKKRGFEIGEGNADDGYEVKYTPK